MEIIEFGDKVNPIVYTCPWCHTIFRYTKADITTKLSEEFDINRSWLEYYKVSSVKCPGCGHEIIVEKEK